MAKYFVHVVVFLFLVNNICFASKCIQKNPCLCEFDEYSQINLENLIPNNTRYVQDSEQDFKYNYTISYFFSGCKDTEFSDHNVTTASVIFIQNSKYSKSLYYLVLAC